MSWLNCLVMCLLLSEPFPARLPVDPEGGISEFSKAILNLDVEKVEVLLTRNPKFATTEISFQDNIGEIQDKSSKVTHSPIVFVLKATRWRESNNSPAGTFLESRCDLLERTLEIMKLLLDHDADPNSKAGVYTLLHLAVNSGDLQHVKTLVEYGADINARTSLSFCGESGASALHLSVEDEEISEYLVLKGADRNIRDSVGKQAWEYSKSFRLRWKLYPEKISLEKFSQLEMKILARQIKKKAPLDHIPYGLDLNAAIEIDGEETTLLDLTIASSDVEYAIHSSHLLLCMGAKPSSMTCNNSRASTSVTDASHTDRRLSCIRTAVAASKRGLTYLEYLQSFEHQ
ncbi:ankyrin repeat domain-containing protein [Rubinisphaera italica]|uniref:Ankyrin repeat protein n=1 Tax=Rubinisphaera italica TaxID=2527969 RepID=A0A5C5XKH7_9PLAN|nr:ankyrin repeat domain-containing protein [Rubinisphaera italica]TWT62883.1 Ankyrin repeat protein [Rubinisphaera italica]